MQTIVRELGKMILIVLSFALPIYLANRYESAWFLLFFIFSFVLSQFVLLHYEDLENDPKK